LILLRPCGLPLLFCLRNPLFAHDIGSRIKALNARLDAICKSAATFSFLKLESYEDMVAPRRFSVANRRTDPVLEQSAVVGEKIKEDTRALVRRLTDGKHKKQDAVMVVAMVGTGGISKTKLAKEGVQRRGHQGSVRQEDMAQRDTRRERGEPPEDGHQVCRRRQRWSREQQVTARASARRRHQGQEVLLGAR
ncbi:Os05g0250600, partial [Oryza sativa Japonica Group]